MNKRKAISLAVFGCFFVVFTFLVVSGGLELKKPEIFLSMALVIAGISGIGIICNIIALIYKTPKKKFSESELRIIESLKKQDAENIEKNKQLEKEDKVKKEQQYSSLIRQEQDHLDSLYSSMRKVQSEISSNTVLGRSDKELETVNTLIYLLESGRASNKQEALREADRIKREKERDAALYRMEIERNVQLRNIQSDLKNQAELARISQENHNREMERQAREHNREEEELLKNANEELEKIRKRLDD